MSNDNVLPDNHTNTDDAEVKNIVNVQELKDLGDQLNDLAESLELETNEAERIAIESLKPLMHAPNWIMDIHYLISGTSGEYRIEIECDMKFGLDLTTLFNGGMESKDLDAASLAVQAKQVGGDVLGDDLTDIVTNAVTPQALGRLTSASAKTMSILRQGVQVNCALPKEGYALLHRADDLVWMAFPWLLVPRDEQQNALWQLDGSLFKKSVYIAEQAFGINEHLEQRYSWEDLTGGNNLKIEIRAVFHKL